LPSAWTANVHHVHDGQREATQLDNSARSQGAGKRTVRSELKTMLKAELQRTSERGQCDQRRQGHAPRSMLLRLRFLFRNMKKDG
jgi:hypothetical protein